MKGEQTQDFGETTDEFVQKVQQIGGFVAMYFTLAGLLRVEDLKKYVRMFQKEKTDDFSVESFIQ
jgi:hypothetical protein